MNGHLYGDSLLGTSCYHCPRRDGIENDKTYARGREQRQWEKEKKKGGGHTCILEVMILVSTVHFNKLLCSSLSKSMRGPWS